MRKLFPVAVAAILLGCRISEEQPPVRLPEGGLMPEGARAAIADSIRSAVERAYSFPRGREVEALLSLYPDSGRVITAADGRIIAVSREDVERSIVSFWENTGQYMREPRFQWGQTYVDVLSSASAVLTGSYTIPHRTPRGVPHTIGGTWTALFVRRGGRWVIVQEHLSEAPESELELAGASNR